MLRSVLAIVAGFVLIGALTFATTAALQAAGVMPPQGQPLADPALLVLSLAYVAVYAIAGCYLAAWLAPSRPMRHALILGVLGLAFNVVTGLGMRGQVPDWYIAAGIVLTMPYAWIGGRLREGQAARRAPSLAS